MKMDMNHEAGDHAAHHAMEEKTEDQPGTLVVVDTANQYHRKGHRTGILPIGYGDVDGSVKTC